ncbi:hypothetical protein [Pseudomonas sp. NFX98]|uniref:hypothetical protein n=1 Tax=Pseudomonas sp. NFX98 TaxID=3399122 RepID=UPI0039FC917D
MRQHRRRNRSGASRIGPNVPDLRDQAAPDPATQHHSQRIGGHQRTACRFGRPHRIETQRQIGHQQGRSQLHQQAGQIEGAEGFCEFYHRSDPPIIARQAKP